MSGHSKWSTIKHKKGAADAKRSKVFTKIIKEITVAARMGGGDINGNPRLRAAVDKARGSNMPKDSIDRAIKKGTGELEGVSYEEILYEGYGPGGCGILVEVLTDNKNRTVAEIKHIFSRSGFSLGKPGTVAFKFEKKGQIRFDGTSVSEDQLMEAAMEAGADDYEKDGEDWVVTTDPADFETVRAAFIKAGLTPTEAEVTLVPNTTTRLEGRDAEVMLRLFSTLDDQEDVQNVYSDFDIDESIVEQILG
ncbi:MAG: YebC/PmpR family DNA-binding transcriptional regulator [Polyangia bacterium]|jgi:YebC/PmpR family DNA-binding regulatory protein|nr:YebC/PmpR family DNA-binding transcriptional regulator [Polyangia bacterium]